MVRELNFTLEGVQGDLKLEYGPFKQRLYQDGREIRKTRTIQSEILCD